MNPADPIELELMRNLFEAAAEEMGIVLQRTAFSANIKERRDFSCAIFDAAGTLLAQAAHIPVHLGSMPASVQAVLGCLGSMDDGDVAMVNDPFAGGTHLPDITIVSPIFRDGRRIGYVANRAHHADVGGSTPGSMTLSRHIDEEGVRIQPTFLLRGGVMQAETLDRLLSAARTPDERRGDLEAQLSSNRSGAAGLQRIARAAGFHGLAAYGAALLDYSQALMSRLLRGIGDGQWQFEDFLEHDSERVRIAVTVTIAGDRAIVDLRGSADQVAGCINCPRAVALSAVYYCFGCLLDPETPLNGGCFRNVDVLTRPGSVVDAQYPAAVVAGNTETSQRIVDVVFGALAQALPDRIPAASCGTMSSLAIGDSDWTYYETIGGGCGAGPGWDGTSAIQCHMTNTLNTPAEALESQYPLRVVAFESAQNGGRGRFSGGGGIRRVLEALAPCHGTILSDRRHTQPYGIDGAQAGAPGQIVKHSATGSAELPAKCLVRLDPGDRIEIVTPGGGGWGRERPILWLQNSPSDGK